MLFRKAGFVFALRRAGKYNPDGSPDDSDTQFFSVIKENRKRHKILVFLISMFYFNFRP